MRRKIYSFLALMSISMLLLSGCGDKTTENKDSMKENESKTEITTEANKSEKEYATEDIQALDSIKDAVEDYLNDNLTEEEYENFKEQYGLD